MGAMQSLILGTGAGALEREHAAWIRDRQMAQQAEAQRQALEARYAHERWLAEREVALRNAAAASEAALLQTQQGAEADQLRAAQAVAAHGTEADVRNRLEQLRLTQESEEQRRRDALRRAIGKHRASFGARGLTADGGSGEAILLGLVNEAGTERQTAVAAQQVQAAALQQRVGDLNRRNLLEQAQLAERHRLQLLSRLA